MLKIAPGLLPQFWDRWNSGVGLFSDAGIEAEYQSWKIHIDALAKEVNDRVKEVHNER